MGGNASPRAGGAGGISVRERDALKEKLQKAEARIQRQRRLLYFGTRSILLVKGFFQELRMGGHLMGSRGRAANEAGGGEPDELIAGLYKAPHETLEALVKLFVESIP